MIRKILWRATTALIVLSMTVPLVQAAPTAAIAVDEPAVMGPKAGPPEPAGVGESKWKLVPEETQAFEATEPALYIIQLENAPVASYRGGIEGLEATNASVQGEVQLDASSLKSVAYANYLEQQQAEFIDAMERSVERPVEVRFQYKYAYNGVAAELTAVEAAEVAKLPGVVAVRPEFVHYPTTDYGPEWIGAPGIWDGSSTGGLPGTLGEGVVVGVLDTGINLDHPSFAEVGPVDGYVHENPLGSGNYLGLCDSDPGTWVCNDKLIGYYIFTEDTHEDWDGHGSNVASIAAGNFVTATVDITTTNPFLYEPLISGVAPHANIVAYDVCLDGPEGSPEYGCPGSAIMAGIEQAVIDGVDVINYSIGGGSRNPWADGSALGFLAGTDAGIIPVTSAGNAGPDPATMGSPADAPWMLAAAASTHNRLASNGLINLSGGDSPPADIEGAGLGAAYGPAPIVHAGDFGDALCLDPFPAGTWTNGEIVVCDRGIAARVEKGANVLAGGAGGYVLANVDAQGEAIAGDPHVLPGVHVGDAAGDILRAWLASGSGHTATIAGTTFDLSPSNGDIMADFSSRGPNPSVPGLVKPDVAAPGVSILGAYRTGRGTEWDTNPWMDEYNFVSGTSQASPHVAGAAALMRALHPEWTVAETKSALMMTAWPDDARKEDAVTPADPFDVGSGSLRVGAAGGVGLVLDETTENFENADPELGGDPMTLNLASLGNASCLQGCSWERTFRNTTGEATTWEITVAGDVPLTTDPVSFTIAADATQVVEFTADVSAEAEDEWLFGEVTLTADDPELPEQHLPVAVVPTSGVLPVLVEINTRRNAGSQLIEDLQSTEITDLTLEYYGLVSNMEEFTVSEVPNPGFPEIFFQEGVHITTLTVPSGSPRLVVEVADTTSPDLDMMVLYDADDDGVPEQGDIDENACQSATEGPFESCDIADPIPGRWFALLANFMESASAPDPVTLAAVAVPGTSADNMTITGPNAVPGQEEFDLRLFWDIPEMVAGDRWYGAFSLGTAPGNEGDIGTIPVNIIRHEDDVVKTVSSDTASPGDTLTFTIEVQPNVTGKDLLYSLADTIPEGLTYVPGSVTGGATVDGDTLTWNGVMQGGYGFQMSTNATDPFCDTGYGGYVDLEVYDINADPSITGDTTAWLAFTDLTFPYYGSSYSGLGFTDDGFGIFDPVNNYAGQPWINQDLPDSTPPNNVLAAFWKDLEIVYDGANNHGVTLATAGPVAFIEYDDVIPWGGDGSVHYDVEMVVDSTTGGIVFAYDNLVGSVDDVTIGIENADGTEALEYAYNNGTPATIYDGLVVCFDYGGPIDPHVITYQATVDADASGTLSNAVWHNTDNPGSRPEMTSAEVAVSQKIYLPLIFSNYTPPTAVRP